MRTTAILLTVFAAAFFAGCDETTRNVYAEAGVTLVESRADSIAHPVTDNWNEPTNMAINAVKSHKAQELRAFRCRDGAGLVLWREGDRKRFLFLAYYGPQGSVGPPVEIMGDFNDTESIPFNQVRIVWTPAGDAVIAFIATQSEDPTDIEDDDQSDRVYFTSFRRAFAEMPLGPNGEIWGFNTWARAVDTNITNDDDNDVNLLFAATNLVDGTIYYGSREYDIEEEGEGLETLGARPSGDAGDLNCIGSPFVYLGWIHENGDGYWRLEGGLVDLDMLQFSNADVVAIPTNPAIEPDEEIDNWLVTTSGRDIAFTWMDHFDEASQHRLNLVRVNPARTALEPTIDVSRGTQTQGSSWIPGYAVIGDGYRILNGQNTTWIGMQQDGYVGPGVQQPDDDLVIAQINAAGEVQIGEFDSNGPGASEWNSVNGADIQICRGATRVWVYYRQPTIANANTSLFVRALRLDGSRDLTDNVSEAERINTLVGTGPSEPYPVEVFFLADVDPFCSPQTNNDVSCVVYAQTVTPTPANGLLLAGNGNGLQQFALMYARVTLDTPDATQMTLSSVEMPIFARMDIEANPRVDPVLVPSGATSGDCVVFLVANGNNREDRDAGGYFREPRPFVFAPMLPGGQVIDVPVEIGSNNPAGPTQGFADFACLDLSEGGSFGGVATPNAPADRDCTYDYDHLTPNFAHAIFFEFRRSPGEEGYGHQTIWRGRALDLRADSFVDGESRIFPPRAEPPFAIGTGNNATNADDTEGPYFDGASQGDNLLVVFNEVFGHSASPGFIYVNTFDPNLRRWSRAALLSNDFPGPIGTNGDDPHLILVPGVQGRTCDRIVDSWVFWFRSTALVERGDADDEINVDLLQGRRFYDLNLPE